MLEVGGVLDDALVEIVLELEESDDRAAQHEGEEGPRGPFVDLHFAQGVAILLKHAATLRLDQALGLLRQRFDFDPWHLRSFHGLPGAGLDLAQSAACRAGKAIEAN
jgi:hypothetical protein